MNRSGWSSILILWVFLFSNCAKEEVKKETIIVTDTLIVPVHDTIEKMIPGDSGAIFILVRHAETEGGGSDPHLSPEGDDRAANLARILENNDLDAVYSTSFFRTQETAEAVAVKFALTVTGYDPARLDEFSNELFENHKGGIALVVGHSNTTPELLNKLTGTNKYQTINDTVYDNLFIVNKNEAEAKVTQLKY